MEGWPIRISIIPIGKPLRYTENFEQPSLRPFPAGAVLCPSPGFDCAPDFSVSKRSWAPFSLSTFRLQLSLSLESWLLLTPLQKVQLVGGLVENPT